MDKKRIAAETAVGMIEDGMTVGLGTGSTAYWAIKGVGELVSKGYSLRCVATSVETEELASECGIEVLSMEEVDSIDLTIDGADEVDPRFRLIKGLGGALLREKIVAHSTKVEVIIVDDSKTVERLGGRCPLPVEVLRFGHKQTMRSIEELGCMAKLRGGDTPFITDGGNFIYDCEFAAIEDPEGLELQLNIIPGVVENGLFLGLAHVVIVGTEEGTRVLRK
jgi:ribose 5-phosphate isomerase A